MKVLRVQSISELTALLKTMAESTGDEIWFRGHGSVRHDLVPGIYRGGFDSHDEEGMINDFYLTSPTLMKRNLQDGWEWLAFLQHYGLPTRLLDWTQSYLVALFFAVSSYNPDMPEEPCIWILKPKSLNQIYYADGNVLLADNPRLYDWLPKTLQIPYASKSDIKRIWQNDKALNAPIFGGRPVAIISKAIDERLVVQQGRFTLHGTYEMPLQGYLDSIQAEYWRVDIACKTKSEKNSFLLELMSAGVSRASIFPDAQNLAEFLRWRYSRETYEN